MRVAGLVNQYQKKRVTEGVASVETEDQRSSLLLRLVSQKSLIPTEGSISDLTPQFVDLSGSYCFVENGLEKLSEPLPLLEKNNLAFLSDNLRRKKHDKYFGIRKAAKNENGALNMQGVLLSTQNKGGIQKANKSGQDHICVRKSDSDKRCEGCNASMSDDLFTSGMNQRVRGPFEISYVDYLLVFTKKMEVANREKFNGFKKFLSLAALKDLKALIFYGLQRDSSPLNGIEDFIHQNPLRIPRCISSYTSKTRVGQFEKLSVLGDYEASNIFACSINKENDAVMVLLRSDTNTKGCLHWFQFTVVASQPGTVSFSILNNRRRGQFYQNGMGIAVLEEDSENKIWKRKAENIFYYKSNVDHAFYRMQPEVTVDKKILPFMRASGFNTLDFNFSFTYPNQRVTFAYSYPYTFSDLCAFFTKLESTLQAENPLLEINKKYISSQREENVIKIIRTSEIVYKRRIITRSRLGLPIYLLKISANKKQCENQNRKRKVIIVLARQHPGETPSSYVCEGLISFLLSNSPTSQFLLSSYIFIVLPMLNPDGVVLGNTRCNLSGYDLNRQWQNPSEQFTPEVFAAKEEIKRIQTKREVNIFCDLHGHSQLMGFFVYGCNKGSEGGTSAWTQARLLPHILAKRSQFFSLNDCRYKVTDDRACTARVMAWNELKIPYSFTIETSFYGYTALNPIGDSNAGGVFSDLSSKIISDVVKSQTESNSGDQQVSVLPSSTTATTPMAKQYIHFTQEDLRLIGKQIGEAFVEHSLILEKISLELLTTKGQLQARKNCDTSSSATVQLTKGERKKKVQPTVLKKQNQIQTDKKVKHKKEKTGGKKTIRKALLNTQGNDEMGIEEVDNQHEEIIIQQLLQQQQQQQLLKKIEEVCPNIEQSWRDYFEKGDLEQNFNLILIGEDPNDYEQSDGGSDSEPDVDLYREGEWPFQINEQESDEKNSKYRQQDVGKRVKDNQEFSRNTQKYDQSIIHQSNNTGESKEFVNMKRTPRRQHKPSANEVLTINPLRGLDTINNMTVNISDMTSKNGVNVPRFKILESGFTNVVSGFATTNNQLEMREGEEGVVGSSHQQMAKNYQSYSQEIQDNLTIQQKDSMIFKNLTQQGNLQEDDLVGLSKTSLISNTLNDQTNYASGINSHNTSSFGKHVILNPKTSARLFQQNYTSSGVLGQLHENIFSSDRAKQHLHKSPKRKVLTNPGDSHIYQNSSMQQLSELICEERTLERVLLPSAQPFLGVCPQKKKPKYSDRQASLGCGAVNHENSSMFNINNNGYSQSDSYLLGFSSNSHFNKLVPLHKSQQQQSFDERTPVTVFDSDRSHTDSDLWVNPLSKQHLPLMNTSSNSSRFKRGLSDEEITGGTSKGKKKFNNSGIQSDLKGDDDTLQTYCVVASKIKQRLVDQNCSDDSNSNTTRSSSSINPLTIIHSQEKMQTKKETNLMSQILSKQTNKDNSPKSEQKNNEEFLVGISQQRLNSIPDENLEYSQKMKLQGMNSEAKSRKRNSVGGKQTIRGAIKNNHTSIPADEGYCSVTSTSSSTTYFAQTRHKSEQSKLVSIAHLLPELYSTAMATATIPTNLISNGGTSTKVGGSNSLSGSSFRNQGGFLSHREK